MDWDPSKPDAQAEALAMDWSDDVPEQATTLTRAQLLDGLFECVHFWLWAVGAESSKRRHAGPLPTATDYAALLWKVLDLVVKSVTTGGNSFHRYGCRKS